MRTPPTSFQNEQQTYLIDSINEIENKIVSVLTLKKEYSIPAKPVEGRINYFPVTVGAITSTGFWGYKVGGVWVQLG